MEVKKYYVYKITNIINNKIYIGKGGGRKCSRFTDHLYTATDSTSSSYSLIHAAIAKYGEYNFAYEIIKYFHDEDEAYNFEKDIIKDLNSTDKNIGYNVLSGGRKGKHSLESINKIRQRRYGFKFSNESIEKMKHSHKNQISSMRMFTNQQIIDIRNTYNNLKLAKHKNISNTLAVQYNCSTATIKSIINNSKYKEIVVEKQYIPENYKACSVCNNILPLFNFNKQTKSKDGLCGRCRQCESNAKKKSKDSNVKRTQQINNKEPKQYWSKRKLNSDQVKEIKQILSSKSILDRNEIAKKYGVSKGTIDLIASNRSWKHVI